MQFPKFAGRYGNIPFKPTVALSAVQQRLAANSDRLPSQHYNRPDPLPVQSVAQSRTRSAMERAEAAGMDLDEYRARDAAAAQVKHTVMPSHKSNYVVVTNLEELKLMGKKP